MFMLVSWFGLTLPLLNAADRKSVVYGKSVELGLGIPAEPLFRSYTVKDCVTIDVLPRTSGNNVYVGFMVWSNFTATKCRGLVSLNQVIKEIICLQPLK